VHFLSAALDPDLSAAVVELAPLTPYNERKFLGDEPENR